MSAHTDCTRCRATHADAGTYDVLVVGGGVNGAGVARDAAGRGLRVLLCEQDDLASHTSSASTKLIHGGLRYLEHHDFNLVRKALKEREVLLELAPHIIRPTCFVTPHAAHLRPAWLIRTGLFLYDHLARRRRLPASAAIDLRTHESGSPLQAQYTRGFAYSDACVDDARLVTLNALDASERGAAVRTRTRCERLRAENGAWVAQLRHRCGGAREVKARALVNAAGPWAAELLNERSPLRARRSVRLIKGSHIIVRKLFDHPYAYLFQTEDRRVVFAIPYEERFTLIGTTDVEHRGAPGQPTIDASEIDYLCAAASRYFHQSVAASDVVATYSGVRPLLEDEEDDPSAITRDYALEFDAAPAPALSIFGGKITTYRKLAEEVLERLAPLLRNASRPWTANAPLPGGDAPASDWNAWSAALTQRYPWLPSELRTRYARAYGTRIKRLLHGANGLADLGQLIAPGLYAREIDYLRREEWAETADDILWRRTKLGLHLSQAQAERVEIWMRSDAAWAS